MAKFLYNIFIKVYPFIIHIASPFKEKARLWIKGRNRVFERMKESISEKDKIIWMHCSSLGEFEQGRPLLDKIRNKYQGYKIILTFFSPSGYEVRKNYNGAHFIFYLPMDSRKNALTFLNIANPSLIIFVKYEFWYHYLVEAKKKEIPLLLISAIFRKKQPFFSKHGSFHRSMLLCFRHLFVQNAQSVALLEEIGFVDNVSLSGDTRFDRVIEIAENFQPISLIENFCGDTKVVVAGSTWLADDQELAPYVNASVKVKFVIAPHDIGRDRLEDCRKLYKGSVLFSSLSGLTSVSEFNTIIIDSVGMLSSLYKYATVCYVGGGFGAAGVHNVLEAAVYGKPVVFGPEYEKFNEAVEIIKTGGGISIENGQELQNTFDRLLGNPRELGQMGRASLDYIYSNRGSTEKILQFIQENRLLTN